MKEVRDVGMGGGGGGRGMGMGERELEGKDCVFGSGGVALKRWRSERMYGKCRRM